MAPSDPAGHHRTVAANFGAVVDATTDWDAPTPVPEWQARDVVRHLHGWFGGFLAAGAGIELPAGPPIDTDPAGAWRQRADAVQAVLDDPATAYRTFELTPHIAATPLAEAIETYYTTDVLMHTWDLARASDLDHGLDRAECAAILAGMEPMDEVLRASGQYGPRMPVDDGADAVTRLMAFVGREPGWTPA
jgi:uncharacterized protein (TIGR03086 family)